MRIFICLFVFALLASDAVAQNCASHGGTVMGMVCMLPDRTVLSPRGDGTFPAPRPRFVSRYTNYGPDYHGAVGGYQSQNWNYGQIGNSIHGATSSRMTSSSETNYSQPHHLRIGLANSKTGLVNLDIPLKRATEAGSKQNYESTYESRHDSQPVQVQTVPAESQGSLGTSPAVSGGDYTVLNSHPVVIRVTDGPVETGALVAKLNPGQSVSLAEPTSPEGYRAYIRVSNGRQDGDGLDSIELCRDSKGEYGWEFSRLKPQGCGDKN